MEWGPKRNRHCNSTKLAQLSLAVNAGDVLESDVVLDCKLLGWDSLTKGRILGR